MKIISNTPPLPLFFGQWFWIGIELVPNGLTFDCKVYYVVTFWCFLQGMLNVLGLWRSLICPYWYVFNLTKTFSSLVSYIKTYREKLLYAGNWRRGIYQRECCSMLGRWNWSSSGYRASQWYANDDLSFNVWLKICHDALDIY